MSSLQKQKLARIQEVSNFFKEQTDEESQQIHGILQCLIGSIATNSVEDLLEITNEFAESELARLKLLRSSESN